MKTRGFEQSKPPLLLPLYRACIAASVEMSPVQLESTITCPACGHAKTETMPTDACQWFYECENCKAVLRPKHGDCCVFCSFGTTKCPPIQQGGGCCSDE
jgi:hypothetical protein